MTATNLPLQPDHSFNLRLLKDRAIDRNNEELVRRRAIEKIEITIIFMERNLSQLLRVAALARLAGMSKPHFYDLFKRAMGRTPIDYFYGGCSRNQSMSAAGS